MEDLKCWQSKFVLCKYAKQLLDKITLLNQQTTHPVDIKQIKKAIYYAKKYHGDQKRDSGEPFYSHPLAVASMVADYCFKTDILVISILHDTIEDTDLTKNDIEIIFNEKIANQVNALTRVWADRKISSREQLMLLWHNSSKEIMIIKLLDRLHNMQTISNKSLNKQMEIGRETLVDFGILTIMLKFQNPAFNDLDQKLLNLCYETLLINNWSEAEHQFLQASYGDNFHLPLLYFDSENIPTKNHTELV